MSEEEQGNWSHPVWPKEGQETSLLTVRQRMLLDVTSEQISKGEKPAACRKCIERQSYPSCAFSGCERVR